MSVVSLIGAVFEALFLVALTGLGMALVSGATTVGPMWGQSLSLGSALAAAAAFLLGRTAMVVIGAWSTARLNAAVTREERARLAHSYLATGWAIQHNEPAGRLQELLTTFINRVTLAVNALNQAVVAAVSLTAFLVAGLLVDAIATAAALGALALIALGLIPLRRRIRSGAVASAKSNLNFAGSISELGALAMEMHTFGVRKRFVERIDRDSDVTVETQRRVNFLTYALAPIYVSIAYSALLVGVGAFALVGSGELAVIGAVLLLMLRALAYGQQLTASMGALASHLPFLDSITSTTSFYENHADLSGTEQPQHATPLEVVNLSYEYAPGKNALQGATFRVERGEAVGIVGPSGAGKSTLAQLLLGVRRPTHGELLVSGTPLNDIDHAWWAKRVTFVPQDARLLTGSAAENIRFFRDHIDDAAVRDAAAKAHILDDLEKLPQGLDSHLGERGGRLSGGQRQRLAIARALAGRPEILILDEPTSSLDAVSERLIRQTLSELKGETTILIIAHRLSTLKFCDRIMVVERGKITSLGAPQTVQKESPFFRRSIDSLDTDLPLGFESIAVSSQEEGTAIDS
ncbi:ABC transporter ATP-binding protein [Knoellia sinensis KCTC 19936]|uniref:ABC transporter ATP-binding protein n=1 Tax=Knoellia sinensis KCTC 19936 TaxID=1385520 RepID=A0A0A0JD20_9MICO|nr:ABC transporter ATP-binding protein [Knoellia sinensis KCTC 19936]